jgi:glucose/mannose transport system substrate-binding protein
MRLRVAVVSALVFQLSAHPFVASAAERSDPRPASKANTLTLYHWWRTPYETAAINALIDVFKKKYPESAVTVSIEPGGGGSALGMFPLLRALVETGAAPDAVQMHPGYEAQPFFDGGLLSPIDELWASEGLEKVIPAVVRDMNKFNGHYYSVPVGVHRTNVVWYNKALLDKHKINAGALTTWDTFFKAADDLRAGGVAFPIEVGIGWTVGHVFECIVASQGLDVYEDWINGKIVSADDPRMRNALALLKRFLGYTDREHYVLPYDEAMKRLVTGDAAFCVMGDWALGEFRASGMKYGKDFGSITVPGTKGLYGLTIDTFQHPKGIARPQNSERWLKVVVSSEGQDAFNSRKGSIPARNDMDITEYDRYQQSAMADFKAAKAMYPSVGIGTPEAFKLRFIEIMAAFAADRDVNKAAAALASTTARLKKAYTREWALR